LFASASVDKKIAKLTASCGYFVLADTPKPTEPSQLAVSPVEPAGHGHKSYSNGRSSNAAISQGATAKES
jgi:hypothetical protein